MSTATRRVAEPNPLVDENTLAAVLANERKHSRKFLVKAFAAERDRLDGLLEPVRASIGELALPAATEADRLLSRALDGLHELGDAARRFTNSAPKLSGDGPLTGDCGTRAFDEPDLGDLLGGFAPPDTEAQR